MIGINVVADVLGSQAIEVDSVRVDRLVPSERDKGTGARHGLRVVRETPPA